MNRTFCSCFVGLNLHPPSYMTPKLVVDYISKTPQSWKGKGGRNIPQTGNQLVKLDMAVGSGKVHKDEEDRKLKFQKDYWISCTSY